MTRPLLAGGRLVKVWTFNRGNYINSQLTTTLQGKPCFSIDHKRRLVMQGQYRDERLASPTVRSLALVLRTLLLRTVHLVTEKHIECVDCQVIKNKIKNHSMDKPEKL